MLINSTGQPVGYNLCGSSLERLDGVIWSAVPLGTVCTRELRIAAAGQSARYSTTLPTTLAAGEYRFSTGIEFPLNKGTPGLDLIASEPFSVRR